MKKNKISIENFEAVLRFAFVRLASRGQWEGNCLVWLGAKSTRGYGQIKIGGVKGKHFWVHRLSWMLANNKNVPDNLLVLHHCDNRPCFNPFHLFLGTNKDNTQDAWAKGRLLQPPVQRGEAHYNARFTVESVMKLRKLRAEGMTFRGLSKMFGMSSYATFAAATGRTWKCIPHEDI
jgi:hypothetical protein